MRTVEPFLWCYRPASVGPMFLLVVREFLYSNLGSPAGSSRSSYLALQLLPSAMVLMFFSSRNMPSRNALKSARFWDRCSMRSAVGVRRRSRVPFLISLNRLFTLAWAFSNSRIWLYSVLMSWAALAASSRTGWVMVMGFLLSLNDGVG